jgi:hypothetical protein
VRTYDMGGKDSTLDVAKAIADYASSKTGKIDMFFVKGLTISSESSRSRAPAKQCPRTKSNSLGRVTTLPP